MKMYHLNRTERASLFFATSVYGVKKVAKMMGYANWKIFSNEFRQYFNEHPTPWRKLYRQLNPVKVKQYVPLSIEVTVSGRGLVGVSLYQEGLVGTYDWVEGWGVTDLVIKDNNGKTLSVLKEPTTLHKAKQKTLEASVPEGHAKPVVSLMEGLETVGVSLLDDMSRRRNDICWEVTLEVKLRRYNLS